MKKESYKASCQIYCNHGLPFELAVIYCDTPADAEKQLAERIAEYKRTHKTVSTGVVTVRPMRK